MTVLGRKRSPTVARSATFTSTGRRSAIPKNHFSTTRRWPAAHPAQKSKKLRRPQCPGNHSRTRVRFRFSPGDSPSRIASCHRRRRIVIQRVRKLLTYALKSLCGTISRAATENYLSPVNKLWTMRLSCGALRKTGEKLRRDITRSLVTRLTSIHVGLGLNPDAESTKGGFGLGPALGQVDGLGSSLDFVVVAFARFSLECSASCVPSSVDAAAADRRCGSPPPDRHSRR